MLKSIIAWWKGQFGDGSVTYQEDASVRYRNSHIAVVFPDGYEVKVNPFQYQTYANNGTLMFDTWKPPMTELFLLQVKDRKNWVKRPTLNGTSYNHAILDIDIREIEQPRCGMQKIIRYIKTYRVYGLSLTNAEVDIVVSALMLYAESPKFKRLERIRAIRKQRLDNLNRESDAQRIRNYLENK